MVSQVLSYYEVKKDDLISYHMHTTRMLNMFDSINIRHIPRNANKLVDTLANLAADLALGAEEIMIVPICNHWVVSPTDEEDDKSSNAIYA